MSKNAVVTGAGSGVGQAIALALAQDGWQVALVGRKMDALQSTISKDEAHKARLLPWVCDISDRAQVAEMGRSVLARFGTVDVVVNAAGTNVPHRSLEVLSEADYDWMINTNLTGAYCCVQAFLPQMRSRQCGTIINIVSDAAKQASPKAGPAYSMSKFGMVGLTQSINAEERGRGVRACAILPGDIDTPLLDKRPSPPPAEARARMLRAEDVAECAMMVIRLPSRAIVEEILIRPR
ncbi:MAG: SDR family oxidoreductase [Verrucomicrobia bacterium]|nr:SDR family oxidoreductase [Verrucomicrobiota bacterium]